MKDSYLVSCLMFFDRAVITPLPQHTTVQMAGVMYYNCWSLVWELIKCVYAPCKESEIVCNTHNCRQHKACKGSQTTKSTFTKLRRKQCVKGKARQGKHSVSEVQYLSVKDIMCWIMYFCSFEDFCKLCAACSCECCSVFIMMLNDTHDTLLLKSRRSCCMSTNMITTLCFRCQTLLLLQQCKLWCM